MAHKFYKMYIPAVSMSFTLIILLAGIINLLQGENRSASVYFTFQVFVYLVMTCIADELIGRIDFKTYISHFITEAILIYPITLFFAFRFRWFHMDFVNIMFYSAIYFIVMVGIHFYFYQMALSNAAEINHLLKERSVKNG